MDVLVEFNLNPDQRQAVELIATTPGISQRKIAEHLNKSSNTIQAWFKNPAFTDACFERFSELAGT